VTNLEALIILHAAQTILRIHPADGGFYGSGFFRKRDWAGNLAGENRRVSLRLSQSPCIRCGQALSAGSTGDHIIPLSAGGPLGAQNYLPLCRSCNASKGRKDLIEWWHDSGRSANKLPHDVICAYARLMFSVLNSNRNRQAPEHLERASRELLASLPSTKHASELLRVAEIQAMRAGGLQAGANGKGGTKMEPKNEREEVAIFAGWCVGSCYGDWDPRTEREQERVLKDDSVYAVWRERWVEYTTAKQRGSVSGDLRGDPVGEQDDL
jgi:hypothetical protein